MSMMPIREARV